MATKSEIESERRHVEIWSKLVRATEMDVVNQDTNRHHSVVGPDEAKHIWNTLRKIKGRRRSRSVMRSLVVHKLFTLPNFISLLKLCDSENDKIDVLEIFLLRIMGMEDKYTILDHFDVLVRPYVKQFLLDMAFIKNPNVDGQPLPPLTVRNFKSKNVRQIEEIDATLHKSRFSTDQVEAVAKAVTLHAEVMNHSQTFTLVMKWVKEGDTDRIISMLDFLRHNVTGFTAREIAMLLKSISDVHVRFTIMVKILDYMLDTENRWLILDLAFFYDQGEHVYDRAAQHLAAMSGYPRSTLFGRVQGKRVLFIIPNTYIMDATFATEQNEVIDRMRFVVRDLCRVLVEQLEAGVYFDIIVYNDVASSFSRRGLIRATHESVNAACMWLRGHRCRGMADIDKLWAHIFDTNGKVTNYDNLEHIYYVCAEPPDIIENHLDMLYTKRKQYVDQLPVDSVKTVIHTVGMFLGVHPEDEMNEVSPYLIRLSNATQGTHVSVVLNRFVRVHNWFPKHTDTRRFLVRKWMGTVFQMINIAAFLTLLITVVGARSGQIGGQTCGYLIRKYPTYVTPSAKGLSSWGSYIALDALIVLTISLPGEIKSRSGILGIFDVLFALHQVFLGGFLVAFQNEAFFLAVPLIFAVLLSLSILYWRLEVGLRSTGRVSYRERWFVWTPLSIMIMWVSFNTIIVCATALKAAEWNGFGWQFEWALVMIFLFFFLAMYLVVTRSDTVAGLTVAYCLTTLASAQWNEYRSMGVMNEQSKLGSSFWLMIYSAMLALIVTCAAVTSLGSMMVRLLYKPRWRTRLTVILTVSMQFGNAVTFFAMVLVNLLASSWGYKLLGFPGTPPINHRTCGLVARDVDAPKGDINKYSASVTIMPHNVTFKGFFVIYAWLGIWVLLQMLPHESLLPSSSYHQERDRELGQVLLIRGPTTQWMVFPNPFSIIPGVRKYLGIPKFHRWQLTTIAYRRWITGIGYNFMYACFYNIAFMISFLFRFFWASTIAVFLLLWSLIKLYKYSGAFPYVVTEIAKDDIDKEKVQFERTNAHLDPIRREIKWKRVYRQLNRKNKYVSSLEFWLFHIPISLYIGLISFICILMMWHFIVATIPEPFVYVGSWVVQGWANVSLSFVALVLIAFTWSRSDPMITLAYGMCMWGIVLENTWGTCYWYLPAGLKARKPDADRINQRSRDYYMLPDEDREKKKKLFGGEVGGRLMWFWNLTDDKGNVLGEDHPDGPKWCKHWVERGGNAVDGKPWAFRHVPLSDAGKPLKYFMKDKVPDGDYIWHFGRCRRIFKDIDGNTVTRQETCNVLGKQDEKQLEKQTVKGFAWLLSQGEAGGMCVEDAGTCPYKPPWDMSSADMLTMEYEMAQNCAILGTLCILYAVQLCRKYKNRKAAVNASVAGEDSSDSEEDDSDDEHKEEEKLETP
jgi:hypothetical protein